MTDPHDRMPHIPRDRLDDAQCAAASRRSASGA